jgi:hypothetical protein
MKNSSLLVLIVVIASACEQNPAERARKHVASLLEKQLGDAADPRIGFMRDSTHLRIDLSTAAFPTLADSTLSKRARSFATTALTNYEMRDELDSITVIFSERPGYKPGGWIRHTDTFPVSLLHDTQTP